MWTIEQTVSCVIIGFSIRILSWALILILGLRFPPGQTIAMIKTVLTIDNTATVCIPMCCMINSSLSKIICFCHRHVLFVVTVKNAVSVSRSRTNRENVIWHTTAITIYIVKARTLGDKTIGKLVPFLFYFDLFLQPFLQKYYENHA